jgi:hypothetical protein
MLACRKSEDLRNNSSTRPHTVSWRGCVQRTAVSVQSENVRKGFEKLASGITLAMGLDMWN